MSALGYDNATYSGVDVLTADSTETSDYQKHGNQSAGAEGNRDLVKNSRFKCVILLVFILLIALLLGTVCACIAFAIEIASLKSETASFLISSSIQQPQNALVIRIENIENLMRQLQDTIRQLDTSPNITSHESYSVLNDKIQQQNSSLNMKLSQGYSDLDSRIQQLNVSISMVNLSLGSGQHANVPVPSCGSLPPSSPSGYYWVRASNGSAVRVYCDMTRSCGGVTGRWMRVAELDMTESSQQCPSPWMESNSPSRSCTATGNGCEGLSFFASGVAYSHVCGRAVGYAVNSLDAFANFRENIDGPYLDGICVTHGQPCQHIWSFAGGHDTRHGVIRCPCDNPNRGEAPLPPSFVGDNYFCDGEINGALWDAMDCTTPCCTFNSPPWFSVTLPTPISDDIEVRICADQIAVDEDIHLRLLELYVQ